MNIKFEFKREKIKILVMVILLAGACFLTYYFHAVVRKGTVFTHLFYIPIILSSLWWKRKGLAVAIFLVALLIFSHFLLRTGIDTINDLLRAPMFILVAVITIFLTEKIVKVKDMLWEKNDYLEKLINHANAPIIVWDKQGNITRFNTAFEDLTKYQSKELIGKHFTTIFNSRTEEEVLRKIEQTLKGEYLKSIEITVLDKHGNELILLWNSANVYSSDGKNMIATIAQGQDITDMKQAELEIKRERNFSKNIIATIPDSLVVVDKDLRIKRANRSFYEIFQMEPENMIGASITEILGDKDGKLSTELLNLFGTEDMLDGFEFQYQSKRSGKRILNIIARTIIFAEEEEEEEELIVLQDITERKKAEETLRRFNEELELKVKERTEELDKKIKEIEAQRIATVNISNDLEETNVNLLKEAAERKNVQKELQKRLHELEIFYNATLGREDRIVELKHQVNELSVQLGKDKKYNV